MDFVEILQKTQSAHNHLAQSFQDLTGILSRLVQISADQKEKITELNKQISVQRETILKLRDKRKVPKVWKKVKDLKQEPCSLIEIFCNTVKDVGDKSMNYQIKKETSTKKHKTEKKAKKITKIRPKKEKKLKNNEKSLKKGKKKTLGLLNKPEKTSPSINLTIIEP